MTTMLKCEADTKAKGDDLAIENNELHAGWERHSGRYLVWACVFSSCS